MDFVVRHGLPGTPNRLTTNGGRRRGCAEDRSEGWVLLALWFDAGRRVRRPGSPRTGWGRRLARRLGCWGLCGSTRPSEDCRSAHHEWGRGRRLARRLGCWGLCGSTRPFEDCRSAHHERGGAGDWLGRLGVEGCVVRHDRPKTAGRLTTNGVGPAIGSEGWVLRAVWFDAGRRVRRPGSPRTGWGRRLARRLGCWGLCGSTRPSEDCRSAHHERGRGRRLARRLGCWGLCGSTRPSEDCRSAHHERGRGRRLARRLGCWGLCGSTRAAGYGAPAHHERGGGDDWLGGLGAGGFVVRHDSFDRLRTGSSKTPGRLTTNGVGPASLVGYRNVRPGVSRHRCRARPAGGGRLPRKR